jgi:hypothetical protein
MKFKFKKERKTFKIEISMSPREIALSIYQLLNDNDHLTEEHIAKLSKREIKEYLGYACDEYFPILGHFNDEKMGKALVKQVRKKFK